MENSQALRMGAQQQGMRHPSGDWRPMSEALRDGTWVEVMNTYGVAPSYSLCRWTDEKAWRSRGGNFFREEGHLKWRPYAGDPDNYVDPTGGLQNDMAYWRGAVAAKYGLRLDHFEAEARRNERRNAKAELRAVERSWWRRLLGW